MGTWGLCVVDDGFVASEKAMIRKYWILSLPVIHDQSLENPGSVSGTLAGESTGFVSAEVQMGWDFAGVSLEAIGAASLEATGKLIFKNQQLNLCGNVGVTEINATAIGTAMFGNEKYIVESSYTFDFVAQQNFNSRIHDFR